MAKWKARYLLSNAEFPDFFIFSANHSSPKTFSINKELVKFHTSSMFLNIFFHQGFFLLGESGLVG